MLLYPLNILFAVCWLPGVEVFLINYMR